MKSDHRRTTNPRHSRDDPLARSAERSVAFVRLASPHRNRAPHVLIAAAASLLLAAHPARDTSLAALRREITRIAAESGGQVGAAALHVESGDTVSVQGTTGFPMQSVFKLPLALSILRRVEAGTLRMDMPVRVTVADLRAGHSPLAERSPAGGVSLPLREMLRLAVSESDNTAADLLLRRAGGPAGVTADLRRLGIRGIRVDRGEAELALDVLGIARAPGRGSRDSIAVFAPGLSPETRTRALRIYLRDPRDTATPREMARLLAMVQRGQALRRAGTGELLRMMTETPRGDARLKALLPAGTRVAHKPGTSGDAQGVTGVVNDVGLITLPDGTHLAVAVFVRDARRGTAPAERAIAHIGRALYDHWGARRRARR